MDLHGDSCDTNSGKFDYNKKIQKEKKFRNKLEQISYWGCCAPALDPAPPPWADPGATYPGPTVGG